MPLLLSCAGTVVVAALEPTSIQLPEGQHTHVLRHTFASHFMMNEGNILVLQRALGHASLQMTMRYAHLAPDHLQKVLKLNPLSAKNLGRNSVGSRKKKTPDA